MGQSNNTGRQIRSTFYLPGILVLIFFLCHQAILMTKMEVSVLAIFSNFIPLIYLIGIPYLILGAVKHTKPAILLGTILTGIFVLEGFYLNLSTTDTESSPVTIFTHNLQVHGADTTKLQTLFIENDPDVIYLQEVSMDYKDNELTYFADEYGYDMIANMSYGLAILSKTALTEVHANTSPGGHDGYLIAETILQGQDVLLANVHNPIPRFDKVQLPVLGTSIWIYTDNFRNYRMNLFLNDLAVYEDHTIIIGGDFNTNAYTVDYAKIAAIYQDAFKAAGTGFGFTWPDAYTPYLRIPLKTPMFRLDYIFTTHDITIHHAEKLSPTGSDHLPLIAILSLPTN